MKKKAVIRNPSPRPLPAVRRSRWPWLLGAALVLALVGATYPLWTGAPGPAPEGMVWVPGGEFEMGGDERFQDALPVHKVYVDGFWMDETEVTNAQFARFVEATDYQTVSERAPTREEFPDAPAENLVPGSGVFNPKGCRPADECPECCGAWWTYKPGASWRHPEGPDSDLTGRESHPVVHICWEDAVAYAKWAGKRLPTEAEWERAARGGQERKPYYWGEEFRPGGKWMANVWQGRFPVEDRAEDGFSGTAPVKSFPPNAYGLYDMAGNVWEWCSDWYRPDYYAVSPSRNPQGPDSSIDPDGRGEPKRVQRGGSFLCAANYCIRYCAGTRGQGEPRTGLPHTGFRCVRSPR